MCVWLSKRFSVSSNHQRIDTDHKSTNFLSLYNNNKKSSIGLKIQIYIIRKH